MFNPLHTIDKQISDNQFRISVYENARSKFTPVPYACWQDLIDTLADEYYIRRIYLARKRLRIEYFHDVSKDEFIRQEDLSSDDLRIWQDLLNDMLQHRL
jgi:hypothetical protein